MLKNRNQEILEETLGILKAGAYQAKGRTVSLPHSAAEQAEAAVYLPGDLEKLRSLRQQPVHRAEGRCLVRFREMDSFSAARAILADPALLPPDGERSEALLVLNFANPFEPGGGVRRGAKAQEEDLCRSSSLLLSLESPAAEAYYAYHRKLDSRLSSDAILISPKVDIFRNEAGRLLPEPVSAAVMTCAAPMVQPDFGYLSEAEYRALFARRIDAVLQTAACCGYRSLVLGAFGCGAFGNDAAMVSDLFYDAMKRFRFSGMRLEDCFRVIDFAVPGDGAESYNQQEFRRNFADYYRDGAAPLKPKAPPETRRHRDAIRGCLIGGAVGDALGYAVEFLDEAFIFQRYGPGGIQAYAPDPFSGKAVISDDTQMTLFTAVGLLYGETRRRVRGFGDEPWVSVAEAYRDWLTTQQTPYAAAPAPTDRRVSWLLDLPELYARRAPGNTCLSALQSGGAAGDPLKQPINHSKGCGGVMRVAPVALAFPAAQAQVLDRQAACTAAITHGNPLGWLPAAALVHLLHGLVFDPEPRTLKELTEKTRDSLRRQFAEYPGTEDFCRLLELTLELSENTADDLTNIHRLGEGWVGDEALAIALYCCLRYPEDFSKAIVTAVNHGGDSDSTGAIAGNILGAKLGLSGIDKAWLERLELSEVILEVADDLSRLSESPGFDPSRDPVWTQKYLQGRAVILLSDKTL